MFIKIILKTCLVFTILTALCSADSGYIVQLKENSDKQKISEQGIDGRPVRIIREFDSINALLVEFIDGLEVDADIEDENIESIIKDRFIQWVDPIETEDLEVDAASCHVPCGIARIGAEIFQYLQNNSVNATIAIIDSGIDAEHKQLNVVQNINFVPNETTADLNGHGTHVAGIAAGKSNSNGFVGVTLGAKLIALKTLDSTGRGYISNIMGAIDWVTQHAHEVDVVNMSLGSMRGFVNIDMMHEAIKKSVKKGVVYVVAAGNESLNIYHGENNYANRVPAAYPEVMTVSAMVASDGVPGGLGPETDKGRDDSLASFSNFSNLPHSQNPVVSPGACIDVAAPGVHILSTFPGNQFKKLSGTSMASPHAAGVVARYIAKNRKTLFPHGIKNEKIVYQIRQTLIDNAEPQDSWNAAGDAHDPDPYHEGLIRVVE